MSTFEIEPMDGDVDGLAHLADGLEHREQHASRRVATTMTDREGFFPDLGVQVEAQVVEVTQGLEGTPVDGESYPQTVERLTNAWMRGC